MAAAVDERVVRRDAPEDEPEVEEWDDDAVIDATIMSEADLEDQAWIDAARNG